MAEMIEYHSGKSAKPHRKFLKYLEFFGIIFETEALETRSRALKTRILAWNPTKL